MLNSQSLHKHSILPLCAKLMNYRIRTKMSGLIVRLSVAFQFSVNLQRAMGEHSSNTGVYM